MVGLAHEDHVVGRVGAALGKRHDMMDLVTFGHAVEAVGGEEGVAGADVAHDVFRGDVSRAVDLPVLGKLFKTPISERWGKQICLNE